MRTLGPSFTATKRCNSHGESGCRGGCQKGRTMLCQESHFSLCERNVTDIENTRNYAPGMTLASAGEAGEAGR